MNVAELHNNGLMGMNDSTRHCYKYTSTEATDMSQALDSRAYVSSPRV